MTIVTRVSSGPGTVMMLSAPFASCGYQLRYSSALQPRRVSQPVWLHTEVAVGFRHAGEMEIRLTTTDRGSCWPFLRYRLTHGGCRVRLQGRRARERSAQCEPTRHAVR